MTRLPPASSLLCVLVLASASLARAEGTPATPATTGTPEPKAKAKVRSRKPGAATRALKRGQARIDKTLARLEKSNGNRIGTVRDELREAVNQFIDFEELAKRALGSHWADRTPKEQTAFQATMKGLVEAAYLGRVKHRGEYDVRYDGEQPLENEEVLVRTILAAKKAKIPVDYRVYKKDGKFLVYDVVTDGLSLLDNYRSQFNQIIRKKGFDGLMSTLERKRSELERSEELEADESAESGSGTD